MRYTESRTVAVALLAAILGTALNAAWAATTQPIKDADTAEKLTDPFVAATPRAIADVTASVFPAVVRIDSAVPHYVDGKLELSRGIGSGVIIDEQGHILTNYHVAGRAQELHVTLFNRERISAKLIGDDHWTDLAIIQMDMDKIRSKHLAFRYAEIGQSKSLVPGESVMAVGTPFGLARTMTLGTISNCERTLYPDRLKFEDGRETGDYSNWIQMDVPINPGNSGGPLVDMTGKVVGINTRGGAQNLNFAVPADTVKRVVAAILHSATDGHPGHVQRSDLGIQFRPMQDLEDFYEVDANTGVLIDSVEHFSSAEQAGVQPQDILLAINQTPTNVRFPEELAALRQLIADIPINSQVTLKVKRAGHEIILNAKTQSLQSTIGQEENFKGWGLTLRDVTRAYASKNQLDAVTGVVASSLTAGGAASGAGLQVGDVVLAFDGKPVADLESFGDLYRKSTASKGSILLDIKRGTGRLSVLVPCPPAAASQPSN